MGVPGKKVKGSPKETLLGDSRQKGKWIWMGKVPKSGRPGIPKSMKNAAGQKKTAPKKLKKAIKKIAKIAKASKSTSLKKLSKNLKKVEKKVEKKTSGAN